MNACIVVLPHSLNPGLASDLAFDIDGLSSREIGCVLGLPHQTEQHPSLRASLMPCRLLARLFQSENQKAADIERKQAIAEAETVIVLAGIGQFDDDVWTPVIARLLEARDKTSTVATLMFAWTGLEPLFLPYEARGTELAASPQLAPELLPTLERSAPALAHVLRTARDRDNAVAAPQTRIAALSSYRSDSGDPGIEITFR
jgi:hypothetical protein